MDRQLTITEDRDGLFSLRRLGAATSAEASGYDRAVCDGLPVEDGMTLTAGAATATYDLGASTWAVETDGDDRSGAVLLGVLALRLSRMAARGALPDRVAAAPAPPPITTVRNDFG